MKPMSTVARDPREQIEQKIREFREKVDVRLNTWSSVRGPVDFREMELEIAAEARALADGVTEVIVTERVRDVTFQAEATAAAFSGGRFRHGGTRPAAVTLLGGSRVELGNLVYAKPNRRRSRRRRRNGHRGKGGQGFFPVLAVLGIWFGATPALAGEVCRQVTDSDSVRAGRAALDRHGADVGHKETLRLVNKFSARAVEQRNQWLQQARDRLPTRGLLRGKRVVIATDGGRLRTRHPAKHGRRRTKTGHRRYDAPWREPKLLTIYVIDNDGQVCDEFQPIYDGTLGDADAIFEMVLGYLKALGAHEARELIVVGDGARWIWDRVPPLVERLGIDAKRVRQVIDWCHVVGVLHDIAAARTSWSPAERERWTRRMKRLLHRGAIDDIVAEIDRLAIGRRAKDISEHRDYFVRNKDRMQYAAFRAANMPIGSGAIESAVRRIVNMRMKSNGMFWLEVNAEGMLLMRSYLKANRLDPLIDWSLVAAIPWWSTEADGAPQSSSPLAPSPTMPLHSTVAAQAA
jgi:hypothetical protein